MIKGTVDLRNLTSQMEFGPKNQFPASKEI